MLPWSRYLAFGYVQTTKVQAGRLASQGYECTLSLEKYLPERYTPSMEARKALRVLAELSSAQWGLITSAQAAQRGVSRLDLSRLAEAGLLERVSHGVYRDAGAASVEFEELRATWLATDPSLDAEARLANAASTVVVSGSSAAELHGVGDLRADRYEFTTPTRRQSQRPDIRFRVRVLPQSEITLRHGLPVTTVERTLADLVESRVDLTHVASALNDSLRQGGIDLTELARLVAPLAARNGMGKDDGAAFVDRLLVIAGMDTDAAADRIASMDALAAPIAARYLEQLAAQSAQVAQYAKQFGSLGPDPASLRAIREVLESYEHVVKPQLEAFKRMSESFAPIKEEQQRIAEVLAPTLASIAAIEAFARSAHVDKPKLSGITPDRGNSS
jgi:predicted transcriptional regulator of viral defense system